MVQKVGELSWFERMTKEFENDPEYLREYIMLCSSQIKDQETKIAALEQRFDALSSKFAALVEENAALELERDELVKQNKMLNGKLNIAKKELLCRIGDGFDEYEQLRAENALLRKELDELKEENETLRCHAHDAELAFERNAELKAENATLRKRLDESNRNDFLSQALNEGDGVYRP